MDRSSELSPRDGSSARHVGRRIGAVGIFHRWRNGGRAPWGQHAGRTAPDGQPFPESLTTRRFDAGIVARLPIGSTRFLTLRSSGLGQWHNHTFGPTH